jgi:hypothetical protein
MTHVVITCNDNATFTTSIFVSQFTIKTLSLFLLCLYKIKVKWNKTKSNVILSVVRQFFFEHFRSEYSKIKHVLQFFCFANMSVCHIILLFVIENQTSGGELLEI